MIEKIKRSEDAAIFMEKINRRIFIFIHSINQAIDDETTLETTMNAMKDQFQEFPEFDIFAKIPLVNLRQFYEEIEDAIFEKIYKIYLQHKSNQAEYLQELKTKLMINGKEFTEDFVNKLMKILRRCTVRFLISNQENLGDLQLIDFLSFYHLYMQNNDDNSYKPFQEKVILLLSNHLRDFSIKLNDILEVYRIINSFIQNQVVNNPEIKKRNKKVPEREREYD